MSLSENSGSIITQATAENLIETFNERFQGETISSFIGSASIQTILGQENCIGLRFYNGYDSDKSKMCLVVVGVGKDEQDLLGSGLIYDDMITCPPVCPINGLFPKK